MTKKVHILGMAKSSLILKPGNARSLELDFFKLAFAVANLRAAGSEAHGYLQVISPQPKRRIEGWIQKYGTGDTVRLLHYSPSAFEQKRLDEEKSANRAGLSGKGIALENGRMASGASYGKELAERELHKALRKLHPKSPKHVDRPKNRQPAGTNWDYYGTLNT